MDYGRMKSIMEIRKELEKSGVKTKDYPSLNIENILREKGHAFGKKSRFYKQIMQDGFVFNPYVHRRWLPYQFLDCAKDIYILEGLQRAVSFSEFSSGLITKIYAYCGCLGSVEVLEREKEVQEILSKRDRQAYIERKSAFDVTVTSIECIREEFFKSGLYYTGKHILMFMYCPEILNNTVFNYKDQITCLKMLRSSLINDNFSIHDDVIHLIKNFVEKDFEREREIPWA